MSDLKLAFEGALARVTLNRPAQRNAINSAMWRELPALVATITARTATKVVLLDGAGEQAFSAGADIIEMQRGLADPQSMRVMQEAVQVAQARWFELPIPSIAVIRGACTGGGCGLAVACDLRIAASDSFFAVPPAKLGLVYSLADTERLVALVGAAVAKELLFSGTRLDAMRALQVGLVNRVVPVTALAKEAETLAAEIAANSSHSVRAAKRVVNAAVSGDAAEQSATRQLYYESFSSSDFAEGARAFLEKRPPKF